MKSNNLWGRIVAVAAVLALVGVGAASAQLQSGNLYGNVLDEQGAPLPGVTVTLSGQGAPQVQVTNAQGQFRFLGLSPGEYSLKAELEGFSTIEYPTIVIGVGRNTEITVTLSAAVEDVITVTAESPLLDERKISTGATLTSTELEKIPSARDPWAVLQSTPGVLTDRINVGGNESGQQSQYVGPGSGGDQSVWSIDGVVITDMAALGSSPAYYDFDSFEEMQVTTGGSDSSIATGGVVLNMVTKRGTNEWRGTGRYLLTDNDWQSDSDVGSVAFGRDFDGAGPATNQGPFKQGNRIVDVKDYGVEIGGPIIKDRLWIWGAYSKNEIDLLTIADVSDFTELETKNAKLNAQLAASNSATLFYMDSEKVKIGRNAGPTRPQETTWNQSGFGDTPTALKVEDTHIFSSNFYLTGMYTKVNGGFQLAPQGGLTPTPYIDQTSTWHNSFLLYQTERPQEQFKADASSFFNTGSLSHELKFGAGFREAEVTSISTWSGGGILLNGPAFFGTPLNVFAISRDGGPSVRQEYTSLYAQDTLSVGNLTASIGLRWDKQEGTNLARTIPGSALSPFLPTVSVAEQDIGFDWTRITPRLGLTYALGKERKTLLRASFSRFADQLGTGAASWLNPLGPVSYAYFYTVGTTGQNGGPPTLVDPSSPLFFSGNVNPNNGLLLQSNIVDPDLNAPLTDEVLLGIEHALLPEFVVGVNLTYRKLSEGLEGETLIFDGDSYSAANINRLGRPHQRSDYQPVNLTGVLPDGSTYATQVWVLKPQFSSRGALLENGDRESEYQGVSLVFTKRLANRWMLRGNFTHANWEWSSVPDSEIQNPTEFLGGGAREGDAVLQGSGNGSGAKGGVYITPSGWSYSVNGLYQIAPDKGWGFNVALNLNGHEAYAIPYWRRIGLGANQNFGAYAVSVTPDPDTYRLDDIHMVDARIEKEFNFNDFGLTVGIDGFNLFNEAYVLQRNHRVLQGTSNHVREITSPRIFRVGARLSFR
jgi:hypothetical protein